MELWLALVVAVVTVIAGGFQTAAAVLEIMKIREQKEKKSSIPLGAMLE